MPRRSSFAMRSRREKISGARERRPIKSQNWTRSRNHLVRLCSRRTLPQASEGAVKKRSQLKTKMAGKSQWTKRDKTSGAFMATKKSKKKFKGVRRERTK